MTANKVSVAKIITTPPPLYAAIDLGTNSCRLLIAQYTQDGIKIVDAFSKAVCLGEGLNATKRLNDQACHRTMQSLKTIKAKIVKHNVVKIRAVATEACRQAQNGQQFLDQIKHSLDIDFEILDNKEEACLAAIGCKSLLDINMQNNLIFDIGGGSTQLTWLKDNIVQDTLSIPYGVVTLTDSIGKDCLNGQEFSHYVNYIQTYINDFYDNNTTNIFGLLGTSGTITTLTGTLLNLKSYNRNVVDGSTVSHKNICDLTVQLAGQSSQQRQSIPCIGHERADLMMAGCVILNAICTKWVTNDILVADRGIREGILLELMKDD